MIVRAYLNADLLVFLNLASASQTFLLILYCLAACDPVTYRIATSQHCWLQNEVSTDGKKSIPKILQHNLIKSLKVYIYFYLFGQNSLKVYIYINLFGHNVSLHVQFKPEFQASIVTILWPRSV